MGKGMKCLIKNHVNFEEKTTEKTNLQPINKKQNKELTISGRNMPMLHAYKLRSSMKAL